MDTNRKREISSVKRPIAGLFLFFKTGGVIIKLKEPTNIPKKLKGGIFFVKA